MHGFSLELLNNSNADTIVFSKNFHDHGTSFSFDEMWINNVTSHSDMELKITVANGHEGDELVKSLHFHCHPM